MEINIKANQNGVTVELITDRKKYIEKIKPTETGTKWTTDTIVEQLYEDGLNEDFVEEVKDVLDGFFTSDLATLCRNW